MVTKKTSLREKKTQMEYLSAHCRGLGKHPEMGHRKNQFEETRSYEHIDLSRMPISAYLFPMISNGDIGRNEKGFAEFG